MVEVATTREASLKVPLVLSIALHSLLLGGAVYGSLRSPRGDAWGGPGSGSVTVGIVRNLAGVPLPRPDAMTASRVVDETKGLHKEEPKPKLPEPKVQAKEIPRFEKQKPQKYVTRPSRVLEDETPPPAGAIPYGQGGTPSVPYSQFTMAGHTEGGLGFSGPAGSGEFSGRFPWYVEAVRRRVSNNWLQSAIDPSLRWAPRVVVTFQILRNGSIANVEVVRSSGNASVDTSARRAIIDSSPLEPLPSGYSGQHVTVEFWFDFKRQ